MAFLKKKRVYLIFLIIFLALAAGGFFIHKKRSARLAHTPREIIAPRALHTALVTKRPVDAGFPALARVSTRRKVTIMGRISGRILEMGPREGVAVNKGDLLVRIDTSEMEKKLQSIQAQLVAARSEATRAEDELAREKKLFKSGGSSTSAVEARKTATVTAVQKVKSLEHESASLKVQIGYGTITCPVNGIIAGRLAEPGDMCVPGHPINTITASGGALVRVELPQSILHQVRPGAPVLLSYNDRQMTVSVSRIFPSVDTRALGYVESDVDAIPFGLPSGSRINARIILRQIDDAFHIPYDSLLCGKGDANCHVFTVQQDNGKNVLKTVPVEVRLRGHAGIAVNGMLKVGEQVVIAHESILLQLKNGDAVTVARGELP